MRLLLAPDSFKESISAIDICAALAEVFRAHGHEVGSVPIADGGEGTVDAVLTATPGRRVHVPVEGPLGEPVEAAYALIHDARTAVIEMAAASGLQLVPPGRRDPMRATTFGTGQLIRDALDRGVHRIVVGVGGSATTDAGAGAAQALGIALLDDAGKPLKRGGEGLLNLARIDRSIRHPALDEVELTVACDVTNPLVGAHGAAHTYAPQKGASPEQVEVLEKALQCFADTVEPSTGIQIAAIPGAGAAGGLAAGLVALCGARIASGFQTVAEITRLDEKIARADAVVTGEGQYDDQSAHGKAVSGVCALARKHHKPVHLIAGIVTGVHEGAFASIHELSRYADPEQARQNPAPYLKRAAKDILKAL